MSQATDIYLIESLWPNLKVKRQLGSGLFGSVYEVRTEGLVDQDFNLADQSRPQTGPQEDLSLETAVRNAQNQPPRPERYAIRVLTLPRSLAAGKELARDLNLTQPQDLAAYYKDLVQGVQEEIRQLQDLQFDHPFLKILDYKALKQLQGPGWHVLIRTEFLPSLSAYKPLEDTLYALQDPDAASPADLEKTASGLEAFSPSQALALSWDISQALSALHAHNLAYGPLLPSRIFRQGDYAYKLGGLPLSGLTGSILARTGVGAWPAPIKVYLAPELADGYPASPASDIYALGLLLLQLLSPQDFVAYLRQKMSGEAAGEGTQAAQLAMPHLQAALPDFAAVLAKATAADPQDRYASMEDFQKDLQSLGQSLEDYLGEPDDLASPVTSLPQERDLASSAAEDQDDQEEEAEEGSAAAFTAAEDAAFDQDLPYPQQDDTYPTELEDYDLSSQEAQTYEDLGPQAAWPQDSDLDQIGGSSHEQVWDPEYYPEDEAGYRPEDLENLSASREGRETAEDFVPEAAEPRKSDKVKPAFSETSPTATPNARPAESSSLEGAPDRVSPHKDKPAGQRRWLLPLLIVLSVVALAALLYFGYLFLQHKQPKDLKPQAALEQNGDPSEIPATSEDAASTDRGQVSPNTAEADQAPVAGQEDTPASTPAASTTEPAENLKADQTKEAKPEEPAQEDSLNSGSQEEIKPEEALASLQQLTNKLTKPLGQLQAIRSQLQTQLTRAWQAFLTVQPDQEAKEEATNPESSEEEKPETTADENTEKTGEPTTSETASEPSVTEEATQAEPSKQVGGTTYIVQNGDILYTILYNRYGAYEEVVDRVLAVNPQIENINNLPTGLEIFLPDLD